jgi:Endopolygalacturonase
MAAVYRPDNARIADLEERSALVDVLRVSVQNIHVSVTDSLFNARGDGTADDTSAIQDAINYAIANGISTVYLPSGRRYRVTASIIIPTSIFLVGGGKPVGGVADAANLQTVIHHDFDGDCIVFNGANGLSAGNGGGVADLRICQIYNGSGSAGRGAAIKITGVDSSHKAQWGWIRDVTIEENGTDPWTWGIDVDGSPLPSGNRILDWHISDTYIHVSSPGSGAVRVQGASVSLTNVAGFDTASNFVITGSSGHEATGIQMMGCTTQLLQLDWAIDGYWIGGLLDDYSVTANTTGRWHIHPGRMVTNQYTSLAGASLGAFWYSNTSVGSAPGSFRFSRPLLWRNADYLMALNEAGNDTVLMVGVDANNIVRLSPSTGMVGIGPIESLTGASNNDVVLCKESELRFSNDAGNGTVTGVGHESGNIVAVGSGASNIKWGVALVAMGGGAAPTLGTIGGSGPATAGQNSWMQVKDSTGATFWVPVWK